MDKQNFPIYDICNLNTAKSINELISIDRFKGYVDSNPHLQEVHNHHYYHLVYFTEGNGLHTIDFESFPVKEGMIYFMRPGQVHQWNFEGEFDGYVINFSANFWDWIGINSSILHQFLFFKTMNLKEQVHDIPVEYNSMIVRYFENILTEYNLNHSFSNLMIGTYLLQLFVDVHNILSLSNNSNSNNQSIIVQNFQDLIEQYFREKKLPKDYASLLCITPNHLNAVCNTVLGISSGELIRDRIILEAKRLLVNKDLTINEIAFSLNFQDSSYFVKFFKKYTSFTPDQFRKQYYL